MSNNRNTKMVDAVYVTELAERLGTHEASKLLGYSQAAVATVVRTGECRFVAERLAEFLLRDMDETSPEEVLPERGAVLICQVPAETKEAFAAVVGAMNIPTTALEL